MNKWNNTVSDTEVCKRLIDLFLVSVLLDAGAGNSWTYREEGGNVYSRSEGLAIASLAMFKQGIFSSDSNQPCRVDGNYYYQSFQQEVLLTFQFSGRAVQTVHRRYRGRNASK